VYVPAHVSGVIAGSLLKFNPLGPRQLKGLEQPVEVLEFLWQFDPSLGSPEEQRLDPLPKRATGPSR
jgi:hypothetical protein